MGEADPSQAVNFAELPNRGMQPAGKRLDGRAASWLAGRWSGSATSLTFDEGPPSPSVCTVVQSCDRYRISRGNMQLLRPLLRVGEGSIVLLQVVALPMLF